MKTSLNDRFKRVQGTFKITEKQLITSRYLQITLERADGSELESFEIGGKVKIRPEKEEKENRHIRDRKSDKVSPFLITNVEPDSNKITIEALSVIEDDPFFKKIMNEDVQTVCLKSKGDKIEHKGRHKKHKRTRMHHSKHEDVRHGKHEGVYQGKGKHCHESRSADELVSHHHQKHHAHKKKQHSFHGDHSCCHHNHHKYVHFYAMIE